jgi:predicted membrane chloride channel (bestrophin family)
MRFLKDWIKNLWITILVFIGASIFMFIFMKIFYPETISALSLMSQFGIQLANALKLWPFIILAIIISAIPKQRDK